MKNKVITVNYTTGENYKELSAETCQLIKETIAFAANAYAPYSQFKVSAALILDDGKILKGTNVENASYPVCICAERTLVSHSVSNYPTNIIKIIAIYVDKQLPSPVPPCGLCRQTLLEVEMRQKSAIEIILVGKDDSYVQFSKAADLLPLYFDGKSL